MFLNAAVQVVLNLTDTWFVSHLSTTATAAIGAVYFLVMVFILLFGGIGMGAQTLVAQAWGAGDAAAATRFTWAAIWASLASLPLLWWIGDLGPALLAPFALEPAIARDALAFWGPRLHGGVLAVLLFVFSSFYNGIGRPRITLAIMVLTALANAVLNAVLIRGMGLGIAGSAMATSAAQGIGAALGFAAFLFANPAGAQAARRLWRPHLADLRRVFAIGVPTGLFPAVDVTGFALFQMMMASLGVVDGAATQLVMMLTSVAYLPAIGIGLAGTTLVGQSIGAGEPAWAMRLGTRIIGLGVLYMGGLGVLFALAGHPLLAFFLAPDMPQARVTLQLAERLLWIAAAYQLFDAVNLCSAFCLRGAGDVRWPTLYLLLASWLVFMPLTHALSFAPGHGYVAFLPQLGWGAAGGWTAALVYILLLAVILFARWRSGAWQHIRV
ncbi:MAG: MATE family efflux transporter [Pseudomonadota bacterium]|nr:MATE family efflux transporter [Pseudomonadota bacterium]